MKKLIYSGSTILLLFFVCQLKAQLSGIYNVPGSYPTIGAAISALNSQGLNGPVTINISAGHTETCGVGGYTLTATGTNLNPIVFQKNGLGANPIIVAYVGSNTPPDPQVDGVWRLSGSDFVTIDGIDIQDPNTTNPATMELGYGLFVSTNTNGCQYNTIKNCVITLNRGNNVVGFPAGANGSRGIEVIDCSVNFHQFNINPNSQAGTNSYNRFYNNTIQNCHVGMFLSGTATFGPFQDKYNDIGGNSASTGNTVLNYGGPGAVISASAFEINNQWDVNVSFNTINNNNGMGVNHSSELIGIRVFNPTQANATISQNTITVHSGSTNQNLIGIKTTQGVNFGPIQGTITVNNNLITNCTYTGATSGSFRGIENNSDIGKLSINNNRFDNNSSAASAGNYMCIYNYGAITQSLDINNNSIGNVSLTANPSSCNFRGIYNTDADSLSALSICGNSIQGVYYSGMSIGDFMFIHSSASPTISTISFNRLSNISIPLRGGVYLIHSSCSTRSMTVEYNNLSGFNRTGYPSSAPLFGYYNSALSLKSNTLSLNKNIFSNITFTGQSAFTGVESNGALRVNLISSNTISAVSSASNGLISGLAVGGSRPGSIVDHNIINNLTGGILGGIEDFSPSYITIHSNTLHTFVASGFITGVNFQQPIEVRLYKNRIFDFEVTSANNLNMYVINGIFFSDIYGTVRIHNNLIGDLRSSNANHSEAIIGINLGPTQTPTSKYHVCYNSVYLNAASSGSVFGTICLRSVGRFKINNNILINNSVSSGTGYNLALKTGNNTLGMYDSTSNNNIFYVNNVYPWCQILQGQGVYPSFSAIKTYLNPREANSVIELTNFLSTSGYNPNFLKPNPLLFTQAESAAIPIQGIQDDYSSSLRNTITPDIGAWEGNYWMADSIFPTVTGLNITNACNLSSITVTATISDATGVAAGTLSPRCYYKINSGSYASVQGILTAGTLNSGNWTFVLNYVANPGDLLSYYIVAQDNSSLSNIGALPMPGFSALNINTVISSPANTFTATIKGSLNGIYTVGAGGAFNTLTAAANAYNTRCLLGPVTFSLIDVSYSTSETFPITFLRNPDASNTNSLLVIPSVGLNSSIINSATDTAVLRFENARNITFDGLNNGNSISLVNSNPGNSAVVWIVSTNNQGSGNKKIALFNLFILGGSNSFSNNNGILAGTKSNLGILPWNGQDNDSIIIHNNAIERVYNAIIAGGSSGNSSGGMDGWIISNNRIGPATNGTNNIGGSGIAIGQCLYCVIKGNQIRNIQTSGSGVYGITVGSLYGTIVSQNTLNSISSIASSSGINSIAGICISGGIYNTMIEKNIISSVFNNSTLGYFGARGITVNTGGTSSGNFIRNNMISDIYSGGGITGTFMPCGIALENQSAGLNIENNSVNLAGSYTVGWSGSMASAALYMNATGANINIKNNILSNAYNNLNSTLDISYAIYSNVSSSNFSSIDFNDYYVGGSANSLVLGYINSMAQTNLAAIQSAFGGNANSQTIVPTFVSPTDLHLVPALNIALDNLATPILNLNSDIDNQPRSLISPDIGADEFFPFPCNSAGPALPSTSTISVCSGQTFTLSVPQLIGNSLSYQWQVASLPGGPYSSIPGSNTSGVSYSTSQPIPGVYYYVMQTACAAASLTSVSNEVTVTINPTPTVSIGSAFACLGQSLALNVAASSGTLFSWSGPSNFTSSIQNPVIAVFSPSNIGVYSLTVAQGLCSSSATISPSVTTPTILVSNSGPYCNGMNIQLNTLAASGYTWSGPGGFTSNNQNPFILSAVPALSGVYNLTANVGPTTCIATATTSVFVGTLPQPVAGNNTPVCAGDSLFLNSNGGSSYLWLGPNGFNNSAQNPAIANILQNANGIYTVCVTDSNFCSSTATTNIIINPGPSLSVSSTASACIGQSLSILGSGALTYTWVGPGGFYSTLQNPVISTVAASSSGVYTLTAAGTNSCISSGTTMVTIGMLPQVVIFSSDSIICAGQTAILTVGGANSYSWSTGSTTSTIVVSPTTNTNYTVDCVGLNGCSITSYFTQAVSICTSIDSPALVNNNIVIYPNPSKGEFTLFLDFKGILISVRDVLGRLVYSGVADNLKNKIDIRHEDNGVYILELRDRNGALVVNKIVKN